MKIPSSSIPRISLYYRSLLTLKDQQVISSQELAEITGCSAAQIRKDLAYFGQFGRPGHGYDVAGLKEALRRILGVDRTWNVALIGAGNLGLALLRYKGFKSQGFNIKYVFDNSSKKIDKIKEGIRIKDIREFRKIASSERIDMAIVAVPQEAAQAVIDNITSSGIKAILNFAPMRPKAPKEVVILSIDLSVELEKLTYFLKRIRI